MKVATIVGARPQLIKASPISRALASAGHEEILIHTGQHYDDNMSTIFFRDLEMESPRYNLAIGSGSHGEQTGEMLKGIESILQKVKPDWVIVYGDTNSTLSGVLASSKLQIKTAHVEAGLRSFNKKMPEELNRIVADHLSDCLLCPTETAVDNLTAEGIVAGVFLVGDVMEEALRFASGKSSQHSDILNQIGLTLKGYVLATVHRAENADDPARLTNILASFEKMKETVVFPVHPRTRKKIMDLQGTKAGTNLSRNLKMINPVGYLDMIMLEQSARLILTDSGGVQKEAYWLGIPCITLRDETEWVETVQLGWNKLVGADTERIVHAAESFRPATPQYRSSTEKASVRCIACLEQF